MAKEGIKVNKHEDPSTFQFFELLIQAMNFKGVATEVVATIADGKINNWSVTPMAPMAPIAPSFDGEPTLKDLLDSVPPECNDFDIDDFTCALDGLMPGEYIYKIKKTKKGKLKIKILGEK